MFGSELGWLPDFNGLERVIIRAYGTLSVRTLIRYLVFKYFALKFFDRRRVRPGKILDFGCAFGGFGFALGRADRHARVFLYDADPDAAEKCRIIARRAGYANVEVLDAQGLEKESGFSLILLISVLEHVEEDEQLLRHLREKLTTGGYLYLMVPAAVGHEWSALDEYVGHVRPGYDRAELRELLARVGLQIVAEPAYSSRDEGRILHGLGAVYTFLTRSSGHPLLDFKSLPRLSRSRKACLGLLWPFYRLARELDAAFVGPRADRIALIATAGGGPKQ